MEREKFSEPYGTPSEDEYLRTSIDADDMFQQKQDSVLADFDAGWHDDPMFQGPRPLGLTVLSLACLLAFSYMAYAIVLLAMEAAVLYADGLPLYNAQEALTWAAGYGLVLLVSGIGIWRRKSYGYTALFVFLTGHLCAMILEIIRPEMLHDAIRYVVVAPQVMQETAHWQILGNLLLVGFLLIYRREFRM